MNLKELFESNQNASLEELKNLLNANCKQNAQHMINGSAPLLWRGYNYDDISLETCHLSNSDITVRFKKAEKRNKDRISRTGYNLLMRFIDLSNQWRGFPKRSKSTFCTTDSNHARNFGRAFLTIPFDNVSAFGTTPEDINMAQVKADTDRIIRSTSVMHLLSIISLSAVSWGMILKRTHPDLPDELSIKTELEKLENLPILGRNFDVDNIQEIEESCRILDTVLEKLLSYNNNPSAMLPRSISRDLEIWENNEIFDTTLKIYPQLERMFSPENFGATAVSSISQIDEDSREIWFYGDSLMISLDAKDFLPGSSGRKKAIDILKELLE